MANFVATTIDDVNAKHLNETLKEAMKDVKELSKNERCKDTLTNATYMATQAKLICQFVGMLNHLNNEIQEVKAENTTLKTEINTVKEDALKQREENITLKKALINTCFNLERHQQFQNRDTFKICGIEEPTLQPGEFENTAKTVIKALETANVPLTEQEISASYRVPTGRDGTRSGPKNIMVKCNLHNTKDRVMRNKKVLRVNAAFKTNYPNAFIVEQLTPLRSKVAYMLRNDENVEKTWTINGKIKVILVGTEGNAKPKTIDSLSQLKQVMSWSDEKNRKTST